MRVPFNEMKAEIKRVFIKYGMREDKADLCAEIHTQSSCDGIYSHGTNRVPIVASYIRQGHIDVNAEPSLSKSLGAIEVYNGNLGPGVLNAIFSMERAMELAKEYGIGLVGLGNTNHWMRGGTYGLRAAKAGYITISWTNTESNMPPWGGTQARVGNNPFVMASPGPNGEPVMIDMAMSQYAYGKLQVTRLAGKKLPYPGGYDKDGNLTDDPGPIEESRRILPMGYWKGSSFAFMLDVLGAILSDGKSTSELSTKFSGVGCSQVFMAIDPKTTTDKRMLEIIGQEMAHIKTSPPAGDGTQIIYPGEDYAAARKENLEKGVFVDDTVWAEILAL